MLKFSKGSWHRRIVEWGVGEGYFYRYNYKTDKYDSPKLHNLCPYMRLLVGIILSSPWIGLYKLLPDYCKIDHPDLTKIFLIIGSICSIIHIIGTLALGLEWWTVPLGTAVFIAIVMGGVGFLFGEMALKDHLDERPRSHKPSLVREYMRAKHNKVCPAIEFEGDIK